MLISTETGSLQKYGTNEQILRLLKDSGFDAYDYSMCDETAANNFVAHDDYVQKAKELRAFADQIGILCNQSHAQFPTAIKGNEQYNREMIPKIIRALEVSGILGAKICVVHPCNDYTASENASVYAKLLPYAKKFGVKIATENMWNWNDRSNCASPAACSDPIDFNKHLDAINDDYFTACLDIGHAEMKGLNTSAPAMITALGERLGALHIHDNDKWHDSHEIPYKGKIDFNKVLAALKQIGYKGDVTFEACSAFTAISASKIPAEIKKLAQIGKSMREVLLSE